jgi:hypothetical protein
MAIKHVVTQGVGFTVPSYILTDGIGNFSGTPASTNSLFSQRRRRFGGGIWRWGWAVMLTAGFWHG